MILFMVGASQNGDGKQIQRGALMRQIASLYAELAAIQRLDKRSEAETKRRETLEREIKQLNKTLFQ